MIKVTQKKNTVRLRELGYDAQQAKQDPSRTAKDAAPDRWNQAAHPLVCQDLAISDL